MDFWFWEKRGSDKSKSLAGEILRGIKRTLLGRVPSSFQAAMRFFIVSVTKKRVGWYVIINLQRVKQIVSFFLEGGGQCWEKAEWLAWSPTQGGQDWNSHPPGSEPSSPTASSCSSQQLRGLNKTSSPSTRHLPLLLGRPPNYPTLLSPGALNFQGAIILPVSVSWVWETAMG